VLAGARRRVITLDGGRVVHDAPAFGGDDVGDRAARSVVAVTRGAA